MNYRSTVRCVGAGLLLGTFLTVGAVAQSDDCRRCVTGGGTPGTLPIFKSGSTATRGVVGNSIITQDADGNVFLGPSGTGTISGRGGVFKGDLGGLVGWETHVDPSTTFAGVIGQVDNTNAAAVVGIARASSGVTEGVRGNSRSPEGIVKSSRLLEILPLSGSCRLDPGRNRSGFIHRVTQLEQVLTRRLGIEIPRSDFPA